MNESEKVLNFVDDFINDNHLYINGNRTELFTHSVGFWLESIKLFLAAMILHLKENYDDKEKLSYYFLYEMTKKAWKISNDELDSIFKSGEKTIENSDSLRIYTEFLKLAGRARLSVITDVTMELQKIYYDKEKIKEFERIFDRDEQE